MTRYYFHPRCADGHITDNELTKSGFDRRMRDVQQNFTNFAGTTSGRVRADEFWHRPPAQPWLDQITAMTISADERIPMAITTSPNNRSVRTMVLPQRVGISFIS
jgi:hypothetical protein